MAETIVLFCILYCGKPVTKCASDSLAQTTLKSQRLSGANSYIKFYVKHYDGITYCNNVCKELLNIKVSIIAAVQNTPEKHA